MDQLNHEGDGQGRASRCTRGRDQLGGLGMDELPNVRGLHLYHDGQGASMGGV